MVTGYFNDDDILDTAILVRHKLTNKDALFIKQSGTDKLYLMKSGKDVGTDFDDFNWIGEFSVNKKGLRFGIMSSTVKLSAKTRPGREEIHFENRWFMGSR